MKILLVFVHVIMFSVAASSQPVDNSKRAVVFNSVNVIPMDKEEVLTDRTVVVSNGKIVAIGKRSEVTVPGDALIIDATGKYLMPGLAEMHAHVPPIDDLAPMKETVLLFSLYGITTIRGMLGHPKHLELKRMINSGEVLGPRFYTSGPSLNGNSVKSISDAESLVRSEKAAGYDFLKLHPGLSLENFNAVAKTADEVKIPFAGHVSYAVGVWRAIEAGYATIDHMDGFVEGLVPGIENIPEQSLGFFGMYVADKADTKKIPKLVAELKRKNVWVVPTQALAERWIAPGLTVEQLQGAPEMKYMSANQLENWKKAKQSIMSDSRYEVDLVNRYIQLRRKLINDLYDGGVGILLGSDAPQVYNVPGMSTHHELQYMVDAGLTPYEALRTGTVNVAKFYNMKDAGVIRNNAVSDLILLNGNPLTDISQTQNIEGVMMRDKWLSKEYIEATRKTLEKSKQGF